MTINQLKCVLAEMKRIYAYDEKKTEIGGLDLISGTHNRVEIHTVDELTGIDILLVKLIIDGDTDIARNIVSFGQCGSPPDVSTYIYSLFVYL